MAASQRLVEEVLAGASEAFDSFYDLYFGRIYCYALRHGESRAQTEELCRTIFASVLRRLPEWSARTDLDRWVLSVARSVVARDTLCDRSRVDLQKSGAPAEG